MENFFDTICAPATPLSAASVGIIRLSGERAIEIAQKIFSKNILPYVVNHGWILDNEQKIDEVVLLAFCAPKSFTGENVVEIQTHGSPVVLKNILALCTKNGARMAQRGEFSKRAFLNHKIDITQAEAILDLIHAKTSKFAHACAQNLEGALNIKINEIKEDIKNLLSKITASLDFPEDVKEIEYQEILDICTNAVQKIDNILKSANAYNILRQGIKVALVGNVNVGKSSLFNALLNLERAIVTDIAGTTRDVITETLDIKGVSVTLIDTAGMRKSTDTVEKIGIDNTLAYAKNADLILCLFDSSFGLRQCDKEVFENFKDVPKIVIGTKSDIKKPENVLGVSAKTKEGLEELKNEIYEKIMGINQIETEFSTNQRQQGRLNEAKKALERAIEGAEIEELQDLISIDIKASLLALDEITGEVITDDVLNNIFENFCIGK